MRKIYYSEVEQIEYELYKNIGLEIREILRDSQEIGVKGLVSAEEVKTWKDNILLLFNDFEKNPRDNPTEFFKYEQVCDFLNNTKIKIFDLIQ